MNITRKNYEEWLLLYVDNELSLAERIIVDDFLAANPDLQQELEMLQQSTFQADEEIVFPGKTSLLKNTQDTFIDTENCEQYFVLYADDELTNQQKASVEEFVYHHPQFQANFELIQQAKLTPDTGIVFPDKKLLYRTEKNRRVVMMRWYKIAAAAVLVLLIGGASYKLLSKKDIKTDMAKRNEQPVPSNAGLATNDSAEPKTAPVANNQSMADAQTEQPVANKNIEDKIVADKVSNNAVAAKKEKGNSASQLAPVVIPSPVSKPDERAISRDNDMAVNESPKKVSDPSNIKIPTVVTHTEALTEQPAAGTLNTSPGKNTLKNTDMAAIADHSYDLVQDDDIEIQPAGKKNKMRGLLRRVSRVFDKATNADGDNSKGNIRIANFEIALK